MYIYNHETRQQLKDCLELLKMILGPDLLDVYLYGSSLVGRLQKYNDRDILAIMTTKSGILIRKIKRHC